MIASMDISASFDERAALQRLVRRGALPQGATLLADRGYFSRELWTELHEAGILALFRVRRNAARFVVDFLESRRRARLCRPWRIPTRVFRWRAADDGCLPPAAPAGTISAEAGTLSRPGEEVDDARGGSRRLRLRARADWHPAAPAYLGAPPLPLAPRDAREDELLLVSTAQLTLAQCVALYQLRWTVETCFRALKSDLGVGGLRCASVHGVVHGIEAACLTHLLVRLLDAGGAATGRGREVGSMDGAVGEEGEGPAAVPAGDQRPAACAAQRPPTAGPDEAHGRCSPRPVRRPIHSGTVRRPRRIRDKARFVGASLWGRVASWTMPCCGSVARRAHPDRPPRRGAWRRNTEAAAASVEAMAARLHAAAQLLRGAVQGGCTSDGPALVAAHTLAAAVACVGRSDVWISLSRC